MNQRACQSVGIDLGTTYSSIAYLDAQKTPRVVCDSSGQSVMPSVVFFDDEEVIVGEMALSQAKLRADRVVQFVKVFMGDKWRQEFNGQVHTPESISAIILGQLVREAEAEIGEISSAVITVPAYFTEKRRRATQQAGEIAGLNVLGTLNEPMSAALAYGLHRTDQEQFAVVYDLGGGTFDVTVVRITPNELEELATNGNRQLGGRDWDQTLINHICEDFARVHGHQIPEDLQAMQDLQIECEKAKRRLGRMAKTSIRLHAFQQDYSLEVTRELFESLTAHLVQATKLTTEIAIEDAGLDWSKVSRVVLVGGSTHMPAVRKMIKDVSGIVADTGVNPVVAVALGAATYAHMLETGQGIREIRTLPNVNAANAPQASDLLPPSALAPSQDPSPEPAPADASPLPQVRFVTAHGVGIKVKANGEWRNVVLISKNSSVPSTQTKRFRTTGTPLGTVSHIAIEITQGDTPNVDLVEILGVGAIAVPANEAAGQPVDVTLEFDAQGRLHARAIYVATGKEMSMSIAVRGGLQEEEVDMYKTFMQETGLAKPFDAEQALAQLADDEDHEDDEDLPQIELL